MGTQATQLPTRKGTQFIYAVYAIFVLRFENKRGRRLLPFVMVALWNRTGHYIFALWFLLLSFFFFMVALWNIFSSCHLFFFFFFLA